MPLQPCHHLRRLKHRHRRPRPRRLPQHPSRRLRRLPGTPWCSQKSIHQDSSGIDPIDPVRTEQQRERQQQHRSPPPPPPPSPPPPPPPVQQEQQVAVQGELQKSGGQSSSSSDGRTSSTSSKTSSTSGSTSSPHQGSSTTTAAVKVDSSTTLGASLLTGLNQYPSEPSVAAATSYSKEVHAALATLPGYANLAAMIQNSIRDVINIPHTLADGEVRGSPGSYQKLTAEQVRLIAHFSRNNPLIDIPFHL